MTSGGGSSCTRCGASLGPDAYFCPRCGTSIPVLAASTAPTLATPVGPGGGLPGTLPDSQLDALRRATLGEYEVAVELGRGGMATVYLAHDLALDRKVAIKVLAPALLLMGEGMVERFKREARTAAALSHPHIIPIYAVKESNQVLYFVMKYVQGRPLDAVIRDVGPLPIAMAQTIIAQVADALGYAHRHGVIHRDIKSANIMLDEEGWAVVTDFGIAKVLQAQGLTMTGVTVGTPTYMSPEQCATEEVSGASDQYSLGVVAYEMLTGTLPFKGDSIMSVMYAHFNQPPRSVTELRPDCPPNLAAAVMRMLEKAPSARWPSMDDVVAVCGRPSLRHDDPVRREMSALARASDSAHAVAALKTPTSPIALSKPRARSPIAPPGRPGAPGRRWVWAVAGATAAGLAFGLWWAAPWRLGERRAAQPPVAVRDSAPAPGAPAAGARIAAETAVVAMRVDTSARPTRSGRSPARRAGGAKPAPAADAAGRLAVESVTRAAAQRDDSLIRALRASALAAQQRAAGAGATPLELGGGDTAFKEAESLATAGRVSEAMLRFASAASLWADAERQSRARAARDTQARRVAENAPPPVPPAPVDPRPDIQRVIDAYARALESRDLDQVRRAYPGLTAAQQQSWHGFFERVRNLKATLTVTGVSFAGVNAEAIVSGVYQYDNAGTGRAERQPATFRAILVVDSTGWRLTTIR